MDMGEVLIITPCVGVDLCVRKREKERRERGEETMCQCHHPPPGSVTRGWEKKEEEAERGGRDVLRQRERERQRGVCVRLCVCVLLLVCLSATLACVALHLRTESASITGEAIQSLGRGCHPLPSSTKRVNFSSGSAP